MLICVVKVIVYLGVNHASILADSTTQTTGHILKPKDQEPTEHFTHNKYYDTHNKYYKVSTMWQIKSSDTGSNTNA